MRSNYRRAVNFAPLDSFRRTRVTLGSAGHQAFLDFRMRIPCSGILGAGRCSRGRKIKIGGDRQPRACRHQQSLQQRGQRKRGVPPRVTFYLGLRSQRGLHADRPARGGVARNRARLGFLAGVRPDNGRAASSRLGRFIQLCHVRLFDEQLEPVVAIYSQLERAPYSRPRAPASSHRMARAVRSYRNPSHARKRDVPMDACACSRRTRWQEGSSVSHWDTLPHPIC